MSGLFVRVASRQSALIPISLPELTAPAVAAKRAFCSTTSSTGRQSTLHIRDAFTPSSRRAFDTHNVTTPLRRRGYAASTNMATLKEIKSNCRKVICIGRNYADHVKELNNQRPKQPFFFLKPPTSILLPDDGPVLRPKGVTLHFEVELGIVIGKTLRDLDENDTEQWMEAIDSYLLTIDMTARNAQDEAKKKGLPWDIAKGFDTFLPIAGPIQKSKVQDPHNLELWLSVNGQVKQNDNTELMLFRIGRQLSDISKVMTLEKGDIVLTGTPKGVGPVVTGDVMEAGIKIDGRDVEEARIKVPIKDRMGPYEYSET